MTAPLIVPQLRFATKRLETGPLVHYAEQGDPQGEPIVSSMAGPTRGSRPAGSWPCWRPRTMPSRSTSAGLAMRNAPPPAI